MVSLILATWMLHTSPKAEAQRAICSIPSDIFEINPATIPLLSSYEIGVGVGWGKSEEFRAGIKDSTQALAGGISFACKQKKFLCRGGEEYLNFSLAGIIKLPVDVSVGAGFTYFWKEQFSRPTSTLASGGIVIRSPPLRSLVIAWGASGHKRISGTGENETALTGIALTFGGLEISADFTIDLKTSFGFEAIVVKWFRLRAGYSTDGVFGAGLSFVAPKIKIEWGISLKQEVQNTISMVLIPFRK